MIVSVMRYCLNLADSVSGFETLSFKVARDNLIAVSEPLVTEIEDTCRGYKQDGITVLPVKSYFSRRVNMHIGIVPHQLG